MRNLFFLHYITRKKFPGEEIYCVLSTLLEFAEVSPVDASTVHRAVDLRAKDFEDAIQYCSAMAIDADCVVTSNVKDFLFSEIPVYKPDEFLEEVVNKGQC